MSISKDLVVKHLETMSEDQMTEKIIIPLYQKKFINKYYDIEFTGGKKGTEQGCDIIYYEITHDTKAKEYTGIQVKQGNIDVSKNPNSGIAAIGIQAQQAFTREIPNVKDKALYYIKTFIILTTGDILSEARKKIIDQFADRAIRFITGKEISEWINECFLHEFKSIFNIEARISEKSSSTPSEIMEYIEKNFNTQLENLKQPFHTLGINSLNSKIVFYLLKNSNGRAFDIALDIKTHKDNVEDSIKELRKEGIIDADEDGVSLLTDCFSTYHILVDEIEKLDHTIDANDILIELIKK